MLSKAGEAEVAAPESPSSPASPTTGLHWFNIFYLASVHAGACYGLALLQSRGPSQMLVPLVVFLCTYVAGAVGVTAGAHRLWAHKSYEASPALKVGNITHTHTHTHTSHLNESLAEELYGRPSTAPSMRMVRRDTCGAQVLLMLMNSIANQGSILRWSRDHRVHHKVHFFPGESFTCGLPALKWGRR